MAGGTYELQVVVKDELGRITEAAKSIQVFREDKKALKDVAVVPNPYRGGKAGVSLVWGAGVSGDAVLSFYNSAGEIVKAINTRLENGSAVWDARATDGSPAAQGLYIFVLQAKTSEGYLERKTGKIVIMKNKK